MMDDRSNSPSRRVTARPAWQRHVCLALGAIGLAVALSGCVVVPARGYYHPYRYGYYAY